MSKIKRESLETEEHGNSTRTCNQSKEIISLQVDDIMLDEEYRVRPKLHDSAVRRYSVYYSDYKAAVDSGEKPDFPLDLITVWCDAGRGQYVLICGYHRLAAARKVGLTEMLVIAFHGTPDEAFQVALTDNAKHGEAMSGGDKKYAILKALERYDGVKGMREIGREIGCSPSYISRLNRELCGKKSTATQKEAEESPPPKKTTEERMNVVVRHLNKFWNTLAVEDYDAFLEKMDMWCSQSKQMRNTFDG